MLSTARELSHLSPALWDKHPYSQSSGFSVVMYRCEHWTIKKAEHQRIDVFKLWCWIRLLRVPWTARRSNQSILNEINSEYSLEGLMLKLKFLILWSPYVKSLLTEKEPDAGNNWGQEEKGETEDEMVDGITDLMDINLSKLREIMKDSETWLLQFIGLQRVRQDLVTEQQQDLETTKMVGIGR